MMYEGLIAKWRKEAKNYQGNPSVANTFEYCANDLEHLKPMTVREAFEAAYGPIPEGATCHVGYSPAGPILNSEGFPDDGFPYEWDGNAWSLLVQGEWGPDISDRPASAFLGFFGERYDEVVG